jgi:2-dehydro-3-deoxygalactonokinase
VYLATIDCGTTHSRVYIIDEHARIIGKASVKVGVRDAAVSGSNQVLKTALIDAFHMALESTKLQLADIRFAIASGMITSEIGLLEIPHLRAPVKPDVLARNMKRVHDTSIFPIDVPVYFVPGIKNGFDSHTITIQDVGCLDFMRGEEVQVAGLLSSHDIILPTTVVVLSSHTKYIPIDKNRNILGSITTLSGQIYEAILKETSIGKSIKKNGAFEKEGYFDSSIIDAAYHWVMTSGFLRSLLMPRFLDVLLDTKWYERKLFVEAAIAAEDTKAIGQFDGLGFPIETGFVLIGDKRRCAIYEHLLRSKRFLKQDITTISDPEAIDRLNIAGSIYLAKTAGLFQAREKEKSLFLR